MNLLVFAIKNIKELEILEKLPSEVNVNIIYNIADLSKYAAEADALFLCTRSQVRECLIKVLELNPKLKWAHTWWPGVDSLIFPGLEKYPVVLTNAKGQYASPLAEFVIFSCLYFAKDYPRLLRNKNAVNWEQFENELISGKTIGIFGYGEIGKQTAKKAKALGMRVLACKKHNTNLDDNVDQLIPLQEVKTLFKESDYIVNAAPLTDETKAFIDYEKISLMKSSSVIINVGRGPVIKEQDLIRALTEDKIKGAALDVFENEPLDINSPLWKMENVIISPHSSDQNKGWLERPYEFFVENCIRFIKVKELENIVDLKLGY